MKTENALEFARADEPMGDAVLRFLVEKYNEETADRFNRILVDFIPDVNVKLFGFIPLSTGMIETVALRILDSMTPELALKAVETAFVRFGWATDRGPGGHLRRAQFPGSS